MALIDDRITILLQHPRAQHPRPRPRRLIRINLRPPRPHHLVVAVAPLASGRLDLDVGLARAPLVPAVCVAGALAPAPEASLGGLDARAEDGLVDEAEVGGEGVGRELVDDRDGVGGVVGEGAELAPVAVELFGVVALGLVSR